ncbi:hypothetical protein FSP39_011756 [Pinctada imbricata]|uniref:G-protein coupled receptors family 1 profile domain-containing protein n=1 Tax=Pinctada imbricata TaxID=66713 RepID=A0AA88Y0I4_PINIB|nr:hypothetical protein FSP39_011756 [Pinctada imbricata]
MVKMNESGSNYTLESAPGIPGAIQTSFILLYTFVIIIAIGGNGIVCYLVYAYKRMRTIPNYFIVNLAISDIIMAIFCIPFTFIANLMLNYWPFGDLMCPIVSYLQIVSVFLSAHTLTAMSLDRYIVIVHPFRGRITTRNTMFVILAIWVLALIVPVPTLFKARVQYYSNTSGQCLEIWDGDITGRYVYSLSIMILHYFGPLLVLLFCYIAIGYNIWMKNIHGDEENNRKLQLASAKQKLKRYARASTKYTDFVLRARRLSDKLLSQGYVCDRLTSSLRKFYGRYWELVIHYDVPLSRMVDDILS